MRISPTFKDKEETITGLAKSVESALEICRRKARGECDEIVKEYIGQYVSGKCQEHMKSFPAMIQDAKRNHFEGIYCRRVDRFGRNLDERIKTEIELHSVGVSLYFVEENIDTRSEIGRLVMNILSHVSEWKRREILENTQRGREELKRQIEAGTTDKRFGRTAKKINIRSVIDMKNKGMTWATISNYVNVSVPTIQSRLKDAGYKFEKGCIVKA